MNGRRVTTRYRQAGVQSGLLTSLLLIAVAVLGVAWVYAGMVTRDQWPIRWLEIDGAFERVSAEQLRARLTPLVAGSFFTVDLDQIRAAAFRQPWVSGVVVQKRWPDTVQVTVTEHEPVAHWTGGRLLNARGEAFLVPGADEIQGLPWLESPDDLREEVFGAWRAFDALLNPEGLEIDRLEVDRRGAWYMRLTNGTRVQIGRDEERERLVRFVRSWPLLVESRGAAPRGVDLRYTNGLAVRWPEEEGTYGKES